MVALWGRQARILDVLQLGHGALVGHVAGVERGGRLEEHHGTLLGCARAVLGAAWDDDELTFADLNVTGAQLHGEAAFDYEEHLVFMIVMVPEEVSLELDQLHVHAVDLTHDLRLPIFSERGELLRDVDGVHGVSVIEKLWRRIVRIQRKDYGSGTFLREPVSIVLTETAMPTKRRVLIFIIVLAVMLLAK